MTRKEHYYLFLHSFFILILLSSVIKAQTISNISSDSSTCPGATILVTFDTAGFTGATNFQVALSDENGVFAFPLPTVIGNGTSSPITCLIPAGSIPSSNYLISIAEVNSLVLSLDTFNIQVNAPLNGFTSTITASSLNICANSNVSFQSVLNPPISGATYTWFIGTSSVPGENQSTFSTSDIGSNSNVFCEVTIPQGCITNTTATSNVININVSSSGLPLSVSGLASPANVCQGDNVTLTANVTNGSGNLSFLWSYTQGGNPVSIGTTNPISTNIIPAGATVSLTVTSDAQCLTPNPASANVNVNIQSITATPPQITITQDVAFCNEPTGKAVLKVTPIVSGAVYTWYIDDVALPSESIQTTLNVLNSSVVAGQKIKCKIKTLNPCINNDESFSNVITVDFLATPSVTVSDDFSMKYGEKGKQLAIYGDIIPGTIQWTPNAASLISGSSSATPTVTPPKTQIYTLNAVALNGCPITSYVTVTVEPDKTLYLPDAFSPNEDNFNDIFYCRSVPDQIIPSTFLLQIFDETGNLIFESKHQNYGWDGNYKNQPCSQACYLYYVTGSFINSESFEQKGKFILVR